MSKNGLFTGSLRQLLRALLIWCLTTVLLLVPAALILSKIGTGSSALGYLSSAMSFAAALAAGIGTSGRKEEPAVLRALMTAGFLILVLLTVGTCLKGSLHPSGVLSVVSFTLAGVLSGTLLAKGRRGCHSARHGRSRSAFRRKAALR